MITNSFDLIDLMGPEATKEDYASLARLVQETLDDPEMWDDDI